MNACLCLCLKVGGGWLCVSETVYVFERGGWSESMCDSHVNYVRNYARVSVQCLLSFIVRVYNF